MKKILIILLLLIVLTLFTACNQKEESIKIGVLGVTSGFGAYYGQQQAKGLEIAKDEINQAGGINGKKIELIYEDSAANPQTAVTAVQKLINVNRVKYIIGDSWISTTSAIVPITNQAEVILISPVTMLDSLSQDDLFFRTIPSTKDMVEPLAKYAYDKMGSRKLELFNKKQLMVKNIQKHSKKLLKN